VHVDKGSFLLGIVLGLAIAAIIISGLVILAPRGGSADARAPGAAAPATIALPSAVVGASPAPTDTTRAQHTKTPIPTPMPSPTASSTPTATAVPIRYETVDVPPRRYVLVQIAAEPGQTLELMVNLDRDVDLTVLDPSGATALGPTRVTRVHASQHTASGAGKWVVKLDNSFSLLSSKQVLLQYRVLPRR
jgi:hypothetical protein